MIGRNVAVCLWLGLVLTACAKRGGQSPAVPAAGGSTSDSPGVPPEVALRIERLAADVAGLQLQVWERDAQLRDLQDKLDEARREVVRAMAKLQTLATRAEAASAMAEAEVALQALRTGPRREPAFEVEQAQRLLEMSGAEFEKINYGGALYLANQAKLTASQGRGRLAGGATHAAWAEEVPFALPVALRSVSRSNVRDGPGTQFPVAFTVEAGVELTAHAYYDRWVRVTDADGRGGWVYQTLLSRP